jgi:hypothetical protein
MAAEHRFTARLQTQSARIWSNSLLDPYYMAPLAKASEAWAAARSANELLAKLTGHLVERREMRVIRGLADLTDEELRALTTEEIILDELLVDGQGARRTA